MNDTNDTSPDFSGAGPVAYQPSDPAPVTALQRVLANEETRLLAMPGVVSVGIGYGPTGSEALEISVLNSSVAASFPRTLDGVPLTVTVTGPIDAFHHR